MKKVSFIFVAFAFLVTGIFFLFNKDHQPKNIPILTVYTYSSFQSFYGPGPELVKAF